MIANRNLKSPDVDDDAEFNLGDVFSDEFNKEFSAGIKAEFSERAHPFGAPLAGKFSPRPETTRPRAAIDWGQDDAEAFDVAIPTPQQLLAQEIKVAQAAADGIYAKRAGLVSEYQRRALEIRSIRERLSKLETAQKGTVAKIKVCDKAAKAHRQNVFALQEAGR